MNPLAALGQFIVKHFLDTFQEFTPRMKPSSFIIDDIMAKMAVEVLVAISSNKRPAKFEVFGITLFACHCEAALFCRSNLLTPIL